MLTIAYIGNGKSTNRYHLPFVQKVKDIRVKAIYARSASPWQPVEGISYTNRLEDLLSDPEIDLIVLSVPAKAH